MATTRQLTQLHRRQQLALRKVTISDMARLWPALDWADLDATYPGFAARVGTLVGRNRRNSAGLAARYLRAFRVASGLNGDVRIVIPQPLPGEQFRAVLHSTSVAAVKASMTRSVAADLAMASALTLASGAMVRLVLDAGRDTLRATADADPRAAGARRVVSGDGCDYCQEREGTYDLSAHGGCGCTAEPVFN